MEPGCIVQFFAVVLVLKILAIHLLVAQVEALEERILAIHLLVAQVEALEERILRCSVPPQSYTIVRVHIAEGAHIALSQHYTLEVVLDAGNFLLP